jgi:hypothetical protein
MRVSCQSGHGVCAFPRPSVRLAAVVGVALQRLLRARLGWVRLGSGWERNELPLARRCVWRRWWEWHCSTYCVRASDWGEGSRSTRRPNGVPTVKEGMRWLFARSPAPPPRPLIRHGPSAPPTNAANGCFLAVGPRSVGYPSPVGAFCCRGGSGIAALTARAPRMGSPRIGVGA